MPKVYTTLTNIDQAIVRPTIYGIIEQVRKITKIRKDSLILYPGDGGINKTPGSSYEEDQNREAIFNSTNIVHIEVAYDYDEDDITPMDAYGKYSHAVFRDPKLNVYIAPVYSKTAVTINFKYNAISKNEVLRWRDDIRMRLSQMRDINLHSIDYSYNLPIAYLLLLRIIYERREAIAGYGNTFAEYIKLHASDALTVVSDSAGNDISLAIAETQSRIIGMYDFSPVPEKPEHESDNGTWTISFAYKFTFDKPVACTAAYPIIVHNQPLPLEYVDFYEDEINLNRKNLYFDDRVGSLRYFEMDAVYNRVVSDKLFIRIPEFDDYIIDQKIKGTGTVFLSLCQLDPNQPKLLMNLRELGDVVLDKDILDFIINSELPYICKPFYSIFNISLYRRDQLIDYTSISCDSDLNIWLTSDPVFRFEYRIRFSILCDLTLATIDALNRLRRNVPVFKKVVSATNELLVNHPDFNNLGDRGYITELEFDALYRLLTGMGHNPSPGTIFTGSSANIFRGMDPAKIKYYIDRSIKFNTVQVSSIMALKKEIR